MKRAILMMLLICMQGQAATVTRYVDTGSSGGDGTTSAVSGDNAAYATLAACEAAEDGIDHSGDDMVIHCNRTNSGGLDTSNVDFNGWTVGTITITQDDFPSDGVYDNTKYVLYNNNTATYMLEISEDYVTLRNFQIAVVNDSANRYAIMCNTVSATNQLTFDSVIIHGVSMAGTGASAGFFLNNSDLNADIKNCTIDGFKSGNDTGFMGFYLVSVGTVNLYNCTIYGNYYGMRLATSGAVNFRNCAVGNNDDDFKDDSGGSGGGMDMDYIVSDDDHSGDCANYHNFPTNGADDWSLDFTTPGSNYTLLATAANLIDDGLADVFDEDDDIIGTARPQGGGWDIGAYEYEAEEGDGAPQIWLIISGMPEYMSANYRDRKAA